MAAAAASIEEASVNLMVEIRLKVMRRVYAV